jgi:hypothetical protein
MKRYVSLCGVGLFVIALTADFAVGGTNGRSATNRALTARSPGTTYVTAKARKRHGHKNRNHHGGRVRRVGRGLPFVAQYPIYSYGLARVYVGSTSVAGPAFYVGLPMTYWYAPVYRPAPYIEMPGSALASTYGFTLIGPPSVYATFVGPDGRPWTVPVNPGRLSGPGATLAPTGR